MTKKQRLEENGRLFGLGIGVGLCMAAMLSIGAMFVKDTVRVAHGRPDSEFDASFFWFAWMLLAGGAFAIWVCREERKPKVTERS